MEEQDPLVEAWERFFKTRMREAVAEACQRWPDERSIIVDFSVLDAFDQHISAFLLNHPREAMAAAEKSLQRLDLIEGVAGAAPRFHVRVENLPADHQFSVNALRVEVTGKLLSVRGVVQSVESVVAKAQEALFVCQRCGNILRVPQDEHLVLSEPADCLEDQGGCGRQARFKLVTGEHRGQKSKFVNVQVLNLQEPPEAITGTRTPERIVCFLEDDLCGEIFPGDRVKLNAVLRTNVRRVGGKKSTLFDFFLEVVSFEREKQDYDDFVPTPEEVQQFEELAASPDLVKNVVGTIAPSIYGHEWVKLGVALQLFGGVEKTLPDGSRTRGDIHVCMIGDPGVAKSKLGKSAARLSPRGHFANALRASVAGVIGGVNRPDKNTTGATAIYEAGLVVMCHRGLLYLDEIDKARDEALLPALLEPLEQQTASLSMHGARGLVVPCEFAGLFGANPKNGRYDADVELKEQITLPGPFLDRMDLIFALEDKPDETRDARLAETILRSHRVGSTMARRRFTGTELTASEAEDAEPIKPLIDPDFMRKYIAHAKRTVFPTLAPDVEARIQARYTNHRKERAARPGMPAGLGPRSLESIVRLTEAAARMRLRNSATMEDLELALDIYKEGWERLATNKRGIIDGDRVGSAPSMDQRDAMKLLTTLAKRLQDEAPDGWGGDALVREAVKHGIKNDFASTAFVRWKNDGTIMERGAGRWVLTNYSPQPPAPPAPNDENKVRWK